MIGLHLSISDFRSVREQPETLISTRIESRYGRRIATIRQEIRGMLIPGALAANVQGGRLRLLAVLATQRDPAFPDVPTARELARNEQARALIDRVGIANVGFLLQDLDAGQSLEQAIERFGVTLPEFEADLMRRVGVAARKRAAAGSQR